MENGIITIDDKEFIGDKFIVEKGIIKVFNGDNIIYTTQKYELYCNFLI